MSSRPIRVVALMESTTVSGPAKNLIEFGRRAAIPAPDVPPVHLTLVTYIRHGVPSEFVTAAREAGIQTFALSEQRRFDTSVLPELKRIVFECDPDILQSHNIKSHFYVRITGLHKKYPWVVFNHGYTSRDWRDRLYTQFDRWSLRAAHRVVAVCGPFAKRLAARGVHSDRIRVQHNSVKPFVSPPDEEIERIKRQWQLGSAAVVLCVGRLSKEKGHRDLLEAVALLARNQDMPPFRVLLAGDGPEDERLRAAARELGVEDKVVFAGHQRDVRPFYAAASLLALPSHSEGSPNVVLEAMAAGVPVVATSVGGVPEILENEKSGLVVAPHDPTAMAAGIARLLRDGSLRTGLGAAGRERAEKIFTPEAYRRSLTRFYQEVIASRQSGARG